MKKVLLLVSIVLISLTNNEVEGQRRMTQEEYKEAKRKAAIRKREYYKNTTKEEREKINEARAYYKSRRVSAKKYLNQENRAPYTNSYYGLKVEGYKIFARNSSWQYIVVNGMKGRTIKIYGIGYWKSAGKSISIIGSDKIASHVYAEPGINEMCLLMKVEENGNHYYYSFSGNDFGNTTNKYISFKVDSNNLILKFRANDEPFPRNSNGGYMDNSGYTLVSIK